MLDRNTQFAFRVHDSAYKYRASATLEQMVGGNLVKVEYSETEGFECWFEGAKYPLYGFFNPNLQESLDSVKRYARNWIKLLATTPFLWGAFLSRKFKQQWIKEFDEFCLKNVKGFMYEPKHYTRAVKEVYYATEGLLEYIRGAILLFFENDKPYRYRLQDILSLLDKEDLQANPRKEIMRLCKILNDRDTIDWKNMMRLLNFVLFISPSIRNALTKSLMKIDPITIALNTSDLYNCLINGSENGDARYHFLGLNDEGMIRLHMTL